MSHNNGPQSGYSGAGQKPGKGPSAAQRASSASHEEASRRATNHGETSRGATGHGDASHGETRSETNRGETSRGATGQGETSHGEPSHGEPSHGETSRGATNRGEIGRGEASHGEIGHGEASFGETTHGKERADAARNRVRVLEAAERLFREHGVAAVSMDQIAAAAGVGKGTLFRRFGDKAGLAVALLDARERDLQSNILFGPPPLGPGADATSRLVAFLDAYLAFLDANLDLVHMSETARAGARYQIGAYHLWHRHVAVLIAEARPDLDADFLAHALLAPLAADQRMALRDEITPTRARDGLATLARSLLTKEPNP